MESVSRHDAFGASRVSERSHFEGSLALTVFHYGRVGFGVEVGDCTARSRVLLQNITYFDIHEGIIRQRSALSVAECSS
jgi:hypothetical protein